MKELFTHSDLQREVLSREQVIALFYASWCPFCRRFVPVFTEREEWITIHAVLVNLDDTSNLLWEAYSVNVVPTLFYFRNGQITRRLDGVLGIGLSEQQLNNFLTSLNYRNICRASTNC